MENGDGPATKQDLSELEGRLDNKIKSSEERKTG
jgi:hypothetical protein